MEPFSQDTAEFQRKNRLIGNQSLKPSSKLKVWLNWATYVVFRTLSISGVVTLLSVGGPAIANASILSTLESLLGSQVSAAAPKGSQNLQTMTLLKAALNADPNPVKGGGDITIVDDSSLLPESGPSGTLADIEDAQSTQISVYVVRKGDTLSSIAKLFGVTSNTILWANDIKRGSLINPGDTLIILPVSGVKYTVSKGDTLTSIAKKFKAQADEIVQFNALPDGPLAVGTEIIIPDGEIQTVAPVRSSVGNNPYRGGSGPTYVGYYMRPVAGGAKTQGIHGYNGIDIAAPIGTPIMASAEGVVIIVRDFGYNGGYGNYIVINHDNGTQTLYAHNSSNAVSVGQRVAQGQVIAYMGRTGKATGSHVHFEIRGAKNPF